MRVGGDEGKPVVVSMPESPQAQAFVEIARNIAGQISRRAVEGEAEEPAEHGCSGCSSCESC